VVDLKSYRVAKELARIAMNSGVSKATFAYFLDERKKQTDNKEGVE
jgi:hypothetical protein